MSKFTTEQLKAALIELYKKTDVDSRYAYQMTYSELEIRMGDEFDAWVDTWYI